MPKYRIHLPSYVDIEVLGDVPDVEPPAPPPVDPLSVSTEAEFRDAAAAKAANIFLNDGTIALTRPLVISHSCTIAAKSRRGVTITKGANWDGGSDPNAAALVFTDPNRDYFLEGVVVDAAWKGRAIHGKGFGSRLTITDCEVRNGTGHLIDGTDLASLVVGGCGVHHAFRWDAAKGGRADAHGIVTQSTGEVFILATRVDYVSGDAYQLDRGNRARRVFIEGCDFTQSPLDIDIPGTGFVAGKRYGENAIDTKHRSHDGSNPSVPQVQVVIRDSRFVGWRSDAIVNAAALNLKENVTASIENLVVEDSTIAYRLRGKQDGFLLGAVSVNGGAVRNCDVLGRIEDGADDIAFRGVSESGNKERFKFAGNPMPATPVWE